MIEFDSILAEGWIQSTAWYKSLDSTSSHLRREILALNDEDDPQLGVSSYPRLVVADRQTSGRGRGEHSWWSPEGCLMCSIALVEPDAPVSCIAYVTAIAIAKAIESQIDNPDRCKIKWPNDIYVDNKKVAGVLIEKVAHPSRSILIIGTGINVDVDFSQAPAEVRARAISLAQLSSGISSGLLARHGWISLLLRRFVCELRDAMRATGSDATWWHREWTKRCYLEGKKIEGTVSSWETALAEANKQAILTVDVPPIGTVDGECLGMDRAGYLRIRHESGSIGRIVTSSVRIV